MIATAPKSSNIASPFLLRGREQAWYIGSGAVDIFLVDLRGETPHGPRRFVVRVEAGGALFGLAREDSEGVGLLACPLPGTRFNTMAGASVPAEALAKWISALAQPIVSSPQDPSQSDGSALPDPPEPSVPGDLSAFHRAAL